jgi:sensor domain CHASE-containing protein
MNPTMIYSKINRLKLIIYRVESTGVFDIQSFATITKAILKDVDGLKAVKFTMKEVKNEGSVD